MTAEDQARVAKEQLYNDVLEIYDRIRAEVYTYIERSDGSSQRWVPTRLKQQVERGHANDALVVTVANIIRRPTGGFSHR
jgi:hypothetical protein